MLRGSELRTPSRLHAFCSGRNSLRLRPAAQTSSRGFRVSEPRLARSSHFGSQKFPFPRPPKGLFKKGRARQIPPKAARSDVSTTAGPGRLRPGPGPSGPEKHLSISILQRDPTQYGLHHKGFFWDIPILMGFIITGVYMGYPYLNGLHHKFFFLGYPYPNFCFCAFFGARPGGPYTAGAGAGG